LDSDIENPANYYVTSNEYDVTNFILNNTANNSVSVGIGI